MIAPHDTTPAPRGVDLATSRLEQHPMYSRIRGLRELRIFMEHHVVCVLDFMSLVKRLQAELTTVRTPWVPPADAEAARFIAEIALDEESDPAFGERPASHYEWYLAAMDELGADTTPIRELERRLRAGVPPSDALAGCGLPSAAEAFGRVTFAAAEGPLHEVAAVFLYGRENVIPRMFLPLVRQLRAAELPCGLLLSYLERHIEIDEHDHAPLAQRLLARLTPTADSEREALAAAERALAARAALWDAVAESVGEVLEVS